MVQSPGKVEPGLRQQGPMNLNKLFGEWPSRIVPKFKGDPTDSKVLKTAENKIEGQQKTQDSILKNRCTIEWIMH